MSSVSCQLESGMSIVQNEMILHCFDVLICQLKGLPIPVPEFDQSMERYDTISFSTVVGYL